MKKSVRSIMYVSPDGTPMFQSNMDKIKEMLIPVRCNHCRRVYDLCDGEVVHRYTDCTMYKTPCCKRTVDDREYVTNPAFERVNKTEF